MYQKKYFTNEELKIKNASQQIINNMNLLVEKVLDPLRQKVGAIQVNSAYRTYEYNNLVGGAIGSQHCKGEAVDIVPIEKTIEEVFKILINEFKFDQLIFEKNDSGYKWLHVSYKKTGNRNQILLANKVNGNWIYTKY